MSLELSLDEVPFSRRESNYAISRSFRENIGPVGEVLLRHIYGGQAEPIFRLEAIRHGSVVDAEALATPEALTFSDGPRCAEIIMPQPNAIRIRTRGLSLRMTGLGPDWALLAPAGENRWRSIIGRSKLLWMPLAGDLQIASTWRPKPGERHRHHGCDPMVVEVPADADLLLLGYESEVLAPKANGPFDEARRLVAEDFRRWRDACPPAPDKYAAARELAAYVGWSSVVPAQGNFFAPAMLMSKNWMVNTWNWDNYFNAWASTYRDPEFGWNQFLLHIRHQHQTGGLGDAINEQSIGWSYTKPPVHGWVLRRMMDITDTIDHDRLAEVYPPLCRWTEWWFTYRDDDGDGICQYHHGNDSGWDDASAFDVGVPNEAPDLNALLIVQMDTLSEIASRLGRDGDAVQWKQRGVDMLDRLIEHSWRDGQFVSMQSGTHRFGGSGDSLLNYIALVLGHRLPTEQLEAMVEGLTRPGRFLTEWGLATEAVDSAEFLKRGYWRGAIWPPPMMMIIDGLADAGRRELAVDLARRYCRLCATHGFGENHDAITGEAHHDPAYTWAASIWQILAAEYV